MLKGNSPILEQGEQNSNYGIKLIGNYHSRFNKWGIERQDTIRRSSMRMVSGPCVSYAL